MSFFRLILLLIGLFVILCGNVYASERLRIAVLPFEIGATGVPTDAAVGIADMLVTALVKTKIYDIVEREQLQKILSEQKFGMSGLVDPSTAVQIGKMLGIKKIITGKITQMGVTQSEIIFIRVATAKVSIDARIIDVETGIIESAETATGEETLTRISGDNLASLLQKEQLRGVQAGVASFDQSVYATASRKAVDSMVDKIMENIEHLGYVIAVEGNVILIDLTKAQGLQVGTRLQVVRMGKSIIHPVTKKVLGAGKEIIGNIEVTELESEWSKAKLLDSKGELKIGDRVSTKGIKRKKEDE
ncbi:MAG: hypothetical protein HY957_12110 [Nitrospirae bacterium]|nr:hypothetical protein [Nitrospirota bacterium]